MSMPENTTSDTTRPVEFQFKVFAKNVLVGLGSLRITVFLLTLALMLVLIATLQQTRKDIYAVKQQHFSAPVVFVEFQELLTPAWFPETQDVGGGFLMPSGSTVMIAMLLNLLCAHLIRFRIQASGRRLLIGSIFLAVGIATTAFVVSNGNAQGEFQETPLIGWQTQWVILQVLLGAAALVGLVGARVLETPVRRTFSLVSGLILGGLLTFLLVKGDSAFIGDYAMRVVWRLVQGLVASVICYIGASMVFRRKAGIVVIHAGLLILMFGELYTTYTAVEQRIFFFEGQTTRHTFNVDEVEMSVSTPANEPGKENVVAIPATRLVIDQKLDVEQLPFTIRPIAFYHNSSIFKKNSPTPSYPGERGLGLSFGAEGKKPATGTETDAVNMSAAYVQLTARSQPGDEKTAAERDLGTYLICAELYQDKRFDLDTVTIDGRDYQIGLRFQHYYKPYSVTLNSTTRTNYTGTDRPKSYSSDFQIVDPRNNVDEEKHVSMNNPLRYDNETFYQSGHGIDPSGQSWSVFQVVQNTGWMIPYVSCGMVGLGLLLHFLGTFIRFVERLAATRTAGGSYDKVSWSFVIGFVLLFAMFAWRKIPDPVVIEGMDLETFSTVPVVFGGRVQPMDSIARSTLRQLRKYEIPVRFEDGDEEKYPPIQWLADWIFDAPGAGEYRIFKIGDPEVVSGLELIRRKSHLYSMDELESRREKLEKYAETARELEKEDPLKLSPFQKKIIQVDNHFDMVNRLRYAFSDPDIFGFDDPVKTLEMLIAVRQNVNIPMAMPNGAEDDWSVLSPVMAPRWIERLCDRFETQNAHAVARAMVSVDSLEGLRQRAIKDRMAVLLARTMGMNPQEIDPARLDAMVTTILENRAIDAPPELERIITMVEAEIDSTFDLRVDTMAGQIAKVLAEYVPVVNGEFDFDKLGDRPPISLLSDAYRANDSTAFNTALGDHLNYAAETADVIKSREKVRSEYVLNRVAPFYLATAIYIGAFILTLLSWMLLVGSQSSPAMESYANGARRAAFWLVILAFAVHTAGLYLRIQISGRPPVTNLYGSAIFIGWIGVLFGLITERMVGYGFGLVKSAVAGVTTLITAFTLGSEGDTFAVLQAVLDTQFWLSTHVVSITIGYSATLVAGLLGMLYLGASIFVPRDLTEVRKTLAKMVYGVTCLALIFSFTGTVLGGLWADDSWGRFWGWDVKENGALMIVLTNAILLHARWAGLVRERGMAVLAIVGNMVTLWSWFAVNELGVGLHTYGLTEGRMKWVAIAWATHLGFILAAAIPVSRWLCNRVAGNTNTKTPG